MKEPRWRLPVKLHSREKAENVAWKRKKRVQRFRWCHVYFHAEEEGALHQNPIRRSHLHKVLSIHVTGLKCLIQFATLKGFPLYHTWWQTPEKTSWSPAMNKDWQQHSPTNTQTSPGVSRSLKVTVKIWHLSFLMSKVSRQLLNKLCVNSFF